MHLRIATYNIHRCVGRDGIADCKRIAAILSAIDADIIALQEVTSHSGASDEVLAYLAAATHTISIEGFTLTAAGAHYGNALLSKLPVSAINRIDISVKGKEPRGVIQTNLHFNNQTVVLWATHLGLGIHERHIQIEKLLKIVDETQSDVGILCGDFNEWLPWSIALRAIGKRFQTLPSPATFPAHRPLLKLDRIWVRPVVRLAALRTYSSTLSLVASDHLPLVMDISF